MKTILNCFWMNHLIKIKSRSSPWLPTSRLDWRCKLVNKKELITMLKVYHSWPLDWEQTFVRFGSWLWSTSSNQKQNQVQVLKAYPNTTLYQLLYVAISFIFQKDGEKNRCHGWSVFIVIWLNMGIGIYLDWGWTYFWTWLWTSSGCSGLKECSEGQGMLVALVIPTMLAALSMPVDLIAVIKVALLCIACSLLLASLPWKEAGEEVSTAVL